MELGRGREERLARQEEAEAGALRLGGAGGGELDTVVEVSRARARTTRGRSFELGPAGFGAALAELLDA